jgi:hypothetical protein
MRLEDLRTTTIADFDAFPGTLSALHPNSAKNTGILFLGSLVE